MFMEPHDPTRTGSPVPASRSGKVVMSRNEIDALCVKAARGAGMDWGMAEEAGHAVGWLARRGLDATAQFAAHLSEIEGSAWADICPEVAAGVWRARPGRKLCPIAFGATFSDCAGFDGGPLAEGRLVAGPVGHPLLVLPFLSAAADMMGHGISVSWESGQVTLDANGALGGDLLELCRVRNATLTIERHQNTVSAPMTGDLAEVDLATIAALDRFAMKTTVPQSESSRAGAGAETRGGDNG
jgi:hypothetical protein